MNGCVFVFVYRATVIARLTYASSAWRGLASMSDRQRIDSVIDRARRNGYCAPDLPSFDVLCDDADDELFSKAVRLSNHVLRPLLPPPSTASQTYNLRKRTHSLQLPEHTTHLSDKNFITHMLYKKRILGLDTALSCYTDVCNLFYLTYLWRSVGC